jgi:hypothetical protein
MDRARRHFPPVFAFLLIPAFCFAGFVKDPQSVLIIGNSFTFYNTGVDTVLSSMYKSAGSSTFHAARVANAGWYLNQHFANAATINAIKQGYNSKPWDVVVLQGYSNEASDPASRPAFYKAVRQLDSIVRASNSNTYLELTWSYQSVRDTSMFNALVAGYDSASSLIGHVPIIPAGYAFMSLRDSFNLYSDDKHPNESGTYLIASTFYGFLSGKTPVGVSFAPASVTAANKTKIQIKAWDAVLDHSYTGGTPALQPRQKGRVSFSGPHDIGIQMKGRNAFLIEAPAGAVYTVSTVSGRMVKRGVLALPSTTFKVTGYSKGLYLISATASGKIVQQKVVVK